MSACLPRRCSSDRAPAAQSTWQESNLRRPAYQASALPLSYKWFRNQSAFQRSAVREARDAARPQADG